MSVRKTHRSNHAVISFSGNLTWESGTELVEAVETAVADLYYRHIELIISSPGGDMEALRYVRDAITTTRGRIPALRVRTRVISKAASAAAVLAGIGDERFADAGAQLLYHRSRVHSAEITASQTSMMRDVLERADKDMLGWLVERALHNRPLCTTDCDAEFSDRMVLELLWPETDNAKRAKSKPRRVRRLARALGRTVGRAIRVQDDRTLVRLYRRLFETDCVISARLARTLGLIDGIGAPEEQAMGSPGSPGSPGLTVPEWRNLYPPDGAVPRKELTRHTMVLGETGSGKTASCVLPMLAAMVRAPGERLGSALIIDPKRELGPVLETLAPQRLRHITAGTAMINVMGGPRWSLDDDIAAGRWLSAAERIAHRVVSFVPSNTARVLEPHAVQSSNAEFFASEGTSFALAVLAFVLMLTSPSPSCKVNAHLGHDGLRKSLVDPDACQWIGELRKQAKATGDARGPNILALTAWALEGNLVMAQGNEGNEKDWLFARIANAILEAVGSHVSSQGRELLKRVKTYWRTMSNSGRQYHGVLGEARNVCRDFAAKSTARALYFGCEPAYLAHRENALDFARAVSAEGGGPLMLFQPARDGLDALVAMSLKALFFEAVLSDPDRVRGGDDLPLVAYIADEFHRFVTSDPLHGEQSFLDTCRSFGAFCLLASQSVASIEHALVHRGGTWAQNDAGISIMWNNTATKLIFRSTDPNTTERVGNMYPGSRDDLLRLRPLSTLRTGECYAALADGRFERQQLEPFDARTGLAMRELRHSTDELGSMP